MALFSGDLPLTGQALPGEPLHGANGPDDIHAIRAAVDLPIIGLYKDNIPGYPVTLPQPWNTSAPSPQQAPTSTPSTPPSVSAPHGTSHSPPPTLLEANTAIL
jgi:hypothetical protein